MLVSTAYTYRNANEAVKWTRNGTNQAKLAHQIINTHTTRCGNCCACFPHADNIHHTYFLCDLDFDYSSKSRLKHERFSKSRNCLFALGVCVYTVHRQSATFNALNECKTRAHCLLGKRRKTQMFIIATVEKFGCCSVWFCFCGIFSTKIATIFYLWPFFFETLYFI